MSIRLVALPVKDDGRCWDVCEKATEKIMQERAAKMREQKFAESGTREAEETLGFKIPSAQEIDDYFKVTKAIATAVGDLSHLPELAIRLDTRIGAPVDFPYTAKNSAFAVFTRVRDPRTGVESFRKIRLSKSRRAILVTVTDIDLMDHDPVGFKKINVADRILEKGGVIRVTFDQVHLLEIELSRD